MAGSFSNGWQLARQSGKVLMAEKSLLVFPLLSVVASIAIIISFVVPIFAVGTFTDLERAPERVTTPLFYLGLFAFYFLNYLAIAFFNSALAACVIDHFRGGKPTVSSGLHVAVSRLPQIAAWAAVSATVGMVLRAIEERMGLIGRIVISLMGAAWAISSFFVVPVLVVERSGPIDAVKRSLALMRDNWGTAVVGNASISLGVLLFSLLSFTPTVLGVFAMNASNSALPAIAGGGVTFVLLFLIGLVAATLRSIQVAALYEFAASGIAPGQFDGELLRQAFRPKKKAK